MLRIIAFNSDKQLGIYKGKSKHMMSEKEWNDLKKEYIDTYTDLILIDIIARQEWAEEKYKRKMGKLLKEYKKKQKKIWGDDSPS